MRGNTFYRVIVTEKRNISNCQTLCVPGVIIIIRLKLQMSGVVGTGYYVL